MLRFAIIGCGRVAGNHVAAIQATDGMELAAVCDLDHDKANALVIESPVPVYTNYREMLAAEQVDVTNIVTPSGMHCEHAIDVMSRFGSHVVVEKPMALRIEDCERMIATAQQEGVQLHVVLQNRFNKAIKRLRQDVDAGRFGRMTLGTVRLRWCRSQSYYDQAPWRGTWAMDGGVLTNQAIHHIDLLQWLIGDIEVVSATISTQLVEVEVEDTAVAWLRFRNGAVGVIEATTAARPGDFEASVSLMGEGGTVIVEGTSANQLVTYTFEDLDTGSFSETPPNVYGFGHSEFLTTVRDAIVAGKPPSVDGREGMRPVQLLHALYRSAEIGEAVRLDENAASARLGVLTPETERITQQYLLDEC